MAILGWQTPDDNLLNKAIELAKQSDVVLLFVGTSDRIESEGMDRADLILPSEQDNLIQKIAEVNKNTIVVLNTGAPILMDQWIDKINALLEMWFGGSEGGNAIADVLLGNYNPSGKLPVTFPKRWEDCSAYETYRKYPARTYYADDIYVGYRHFDKYNIEPLFPFGFGLSYTTFEYSDINVINKGDKCEVSINLKNTGNMKGAEVVQLYVSQKNPKVDRPIKELKAFKKVYLNPGETQKVILEFDKNSLSYYDEASRSWKLDKDDYEILIGSSSRDIKLRSIISLLD
ncbi:MAG: glycoside hydrolase family 3 C-terminal domain-containing protein [Melioribacter sp.]|uniref:glycoside hydrolase family 3 C-terminal domain-containing protein n=1 Tax=Rosettibacter primus TaxID=3111523 RepID=UPI00247E5250|nr:glycoside hydrolase family 3 C-terminal domain-containing protein [Melioribacter sp.]